MSRLSTAFLVVSQLWVVCRHSCHNHWQIFEEVVTNWQPTGNVTGAIEGQVLPMGAAFELVPDAGEGAKSVRLAQFN